MSTVTILGLVALATPLVQTALMGFIAYPLATRSAAAMERFHRSGFAWWVVALVAVTGAGLVLDGDRLASAAPRVVDPSAGVTAGVALVALLLCLAVEVGGTRLVGDGSSGARRYDEAVPTWAARPERQVLLLGAIALLEEAVYRGIALTWLVRDTSLPTVVAVAVVAVAFGLAHWYYGPRHVVLKTVTGVVLGVAAVLGGWMVAAVVHVVLNVVLVLLSAPRRSAA